MSKQDTPHQKKSEEKAAAPKGAPAGGPGGAPHAAHSAPSAPKGAVGTKVGCQAVACKDKDTRAGFCEEHFKQYKFGLITKSGEKVLDWEKKYEHYQHWLRAQKVA